MTTQPDIPHITRTVFGTTPEADCALCGAHTSGAGIWAAADVDYWVTGHAADCTPASVRQRADHYRDAAELLWVHADADPDDGTDWDQPVVLAAAGSLRAHLYDTAQRLEQAAHDAENPAPVSGSGSAGPRADGGAK